MSSLGQEPGVISKESLPNEQLHQRILQSGRIVTWMKRQEEVKLHRAKSEDDLTKQIEVEPISAQEPTKIKEEPVSEEEPPHARPHRSPVRARTPTSPLPRSSVTSSQDTKRKLNVDDRGDESGHFRDGRCASPNKSYRERHSRPGRENDDRGWGNKFHWSWNRNSNKNDHSQSRHGRSRSRERSPHRESRSRDLEKASDYSRRKEYKDSHSRDGYRGSRERSPHREACPWPRDLKKASGYSRSKEYKPRSRDGYRGYQERSGHRKPYLGFKHNSFDHKKEQVLASNQRLITTPLLVNGKGEPQGSCEAVVSNKLAGVVERYVPLTKTWSSVSVEVKYELCQKVQSMFEQGCKIDSTWIKRKAKSIHDSAQRRAKNELWRNECKSAAR